MMGGVAGSEDGDGGERTTIWGVSCATRECKWQSKVIEGKTGLGMKFSTGTACGELRTNPSLLGRRGQFLSQPLKVGELF